MSSESEQLKERTMQFALESEFWLDTCLRKPLAEGGNTERLRREAGELRAIFGKSLGTARANARFSKISKSNNQITR